MSYFISHMNKSLLQNFLFLSIISICHFSCSKKNDESVKPQTTTVEYKITPMNQNFTKISYKDANGNTVDITDPSQIADGIRTISITNKPFTARLDVIMNNVTTSTVYYSLVISVDGTPVKLVNAGAPPNSVSSASADYVIE